MFHISDGGVSSTTTISSIPINMNTDALTGSSLVVTQSQGQFATSVSFSTPECSPGQCGESSGLKQESDFGSSLQLTHSNGGNGKNSSIVKENEIRKISPPDKVKPLKDESERALDLKMTPLGNGAATSLNNHLGGANNDPIASILRSLGSSVQDSVTHHPCRQTKSNRPL